MSVVFVRPVANAVTVIVFVPPTVVLSITVRLNVAELEPTGIVTLAGTVSRDVSEDVRLTVRAADVEPVLVTVAVVALAPAVSATESTAIARAMLELIWEASV